MELLPWASGLLISGFALFIAYVVLVLYGNSLLVKEERNHLRNSFPYEYYKDMFPAFRYLTYAVLSLNLLANVLGMAFFFTAIGTTYALFVLGALAIGAICLFVSNILPLSSYKTHIAFSLLGFGFFALGAILFSFFTVIPGALLLTGHIAVFIAVLIGILGFLTFFALFNPKLKNWYRLDKTEENGATYYVKPKVNFLALYEWLAYLFVNLTVFLLFVDILVTGMVLY